MISETRPRSGSSRLGFFRPEEVRMIKTDWGISFVRPLQSSLLLLCAVFIIPLCILDPVECYADELEEELTEIVQDFERHIGMAYIHTKLYIVTHSFIDSYTRKPMRICREVENTLVDIVIEKFRVNKNIVVLERDRLQALEKEATFDSGGELTWDKKMFKKLGAGFIITGSVNKLSNYLKIRAKMIDIITGEVVASSRAKVLLSEIDSSLLSDYEVETKKRSFSKMQPSENKPNLRNAQKNSYTPPPDKKPNPKNSQEPAYQPTFVFGN